MDIVLSDLKDPIKYKYLVTKNGEVCVCMCVGGGGGGHGGGSRGEGGYKIEQRALFVQFKELEPKKKHKYSSMRTHKIEQRTYFFFSFSMERKVVRRDC